MDFLPPGFLVEVGDRRWRRWAIMDGVGQWWAGEQRRWRGEPSEAVLFKSQAAAVEERNRFCLGGDPAGTFTVTVVVTANARRWSAEELAHHLKRHSKFFLKGTTGKEGVQLQIVPGTLRKIEP